MLITPSYYANRGRDGLEAQSQFVSVLGLAEPKGMKLPCPT